MTLTRDTGRLRGAKADVLVLGGGIYGAWTAYDAALRGLDVILIERDDWASATSSASSKLIHGGLRYLEQFRLGLVRKSLVERRRLASLGPHRVRPLRFLVPLFEGDRVGRARLRLGLTLYDTLAGHGQPVGGFESLGRREITKRYSGLSAPGLVGGFSYGDCVTDDARFTLEIVAGAARAGAVSLNRVEARRLIVEGGAASGVIAIDRVAGETFEVRARTVVNALGPWAWRLVGGSTPRGRVRYTKGVHLVMPGGNLETALLVFARGDQRVFFLIPWYGCTLLGTTDTDFDGDPEDATVERADIDYLLSEATRVLPVGPWTRDSVLGSFVGVRALRDDSDRPPSQLSREWTIDEPLRGLFVSTGGKFTSARADAARIVDRVMQRLGRDPTGRPPTRSRPLPWCPPGDFAGWFADAVAGGVGVGFDAETAGEAAYRYGTTVTDVHEIAREHPELAARVVEDLPFSKAEVIHAARNEMAVYLEDIVRRRIPLTILTRLDARSLERVASLAAPVLGWDTERRNEEVEAVVRSLSRHGRPPNDA